MYKLGLDKYQTKRIIEEKLKSDPDLKYYIENDYILKLIDLLVDGIAEVIDENNNKIRDALINRR